MDLDEISKLCSSLKLDESDGPMVRMGKSLYEIRKDKMLLCLVGKVFGNKLINREGLEGAMTAAWRLPH
ncbi:hypothetical protein TorRG33x02_241260 [Trema orientale]|uniref:Uncharacterized protein n=1 Tax=Trema orientale TaxID=63057 RepID=A0A2P5DUG4_TREOI|nr:hypothetical protein TorRG33x02_241260 [Trema orientale]